jgi:integrase
VPLIGELAAIIARRKAARQVTEDGTVRFVEYIFHRNGRAIAEFRKSSATACKAAGVEGTRFHDLRRSAVRNLTQAGVERRIAMKISGHRTEEVFERNNIKVTKDVREALERTERYRAQAVQGKVVGMRPN